MNDPAVASLRQERWLDEAGALAERAVAAGGERESVSRATLAGVNSAGR